MIKRILIGMIRAYQWGISPLVPSTCRFYPSCSQYAVEAFSRHGVWRASWLSIKRVSRCGPWHAGGYDPVP